MSEQWRIELLGGPRAWQGDRVVERFPNHKVGVLLAYLACHRSRPHLREELIEVLWPEIPPEDGQNNLRQTLFRLRRQLEPPSAHPDSLIVADRTSVQLNPTVLPTDVSEFEAA